ncbi:MAG: flgM [Anaerosolibacter sp.]|jgi:negative regulator of flagellin synthesis FlgM|uniref:flagellar biosynthesis anti-sigma factor FlgM n=1 Tax=Anaerosolibacter sp. TaxID=1872527 RepID=UPI00260F11AC|nr:flagellar biosynthesis anti-sigma factor FlgM [Anaerosolibacter sp.]MDF2546584.1 flgM [Anaerosolibacter sp.]
MKITNNTNVQKVLGAYKKKLEGVEKTSKLKQENDKVEISETAREFQVALNAYKKLPEIRQNKVDEVTRQIQSGNYNPSAEEVVHSIFDRKI